MSILPRSLLKSFFETGDKPTAIQFSALIDSLLHSTEDQEKLGLRNYDTTRTYIAGEGVIYNGSLYSAIATTTGAFNPVHWEKIFSLGSVSYQGTWDPVNNNPALTSGQGTKGDYYVVSVSGTRTLDGNSTWAAGDEVIFNGNVWEKVASADLDQQTADQVPYDNVSSGLVATNVQGAIDEVELRVQATESSLSTLTTANVTEDPVNLYYTDARVENSAAVVSLQANSHVMNQDTKLAEGTLDEVSATDLKNLLANGYVHSHTISEVTGLQAALDSKADVSHIHAIADVTGLQTELDNKATSIHTHSIADVTNLQTSLDGKASVTHTHLIADVTGLQATLDGKASATHTHSIADITSLQSALDGKASITHTHSIADVTNLQTTLNGKASVTHTHSIADVINLQATLDGKAPTVHSHSINDISGLSTTLTDIGGEEIITTSTGSSTDIYQYDVNKLSNTAVVMLSAELTGIDLATGSKSFFIKMYALFKRNMNSYRNVLANQTKSVELLDDATYSVSFTLSDMLCINVRGTDETIQWHIRIKKTIMEGYI